MRIETDRLLLRRYSMDDVDALVALFDDPEVRRFLNVPRYDREQAAARVRDDEREWDELGRRMLAIVERASGRFCGRVLLLDHPQWGETEIGWTLLPEGRGRGYATEAARAFIGWAFENLDVAYLISVIDTGNERSRAVAQRLGMELRRMDVYDGDEVEIWSIAP